CIDAGHNYSGFDTGATGNGLMEQDVTFKIADKLKNLLINSGISVTMTRSNITDNVGINAKDSINQRARLANSTKCDYFVSIHCNAGGGTGAETLICGLGGKAEKLAKKVQSKIVKNLALFDRGVKVRADLGVLRLTDMPAILVETAFIDNQKDAKLLKENINDFAKAIFEGICEFLEIGETKILTEPNEIIEKISEIIEINDKKSAVYLLSQEKQKNSSFYWILYKIANKEGA
ncbi:MAG: N-acetylmuramoyl-L-alanine amidase, partial [Clostridia bacterium]|nr:N-acetylmuramoyl-L-alanine amidase [Clostridia bacterium]